MSMSQALLPEYDHEMATTRRVLERVAGDLSFRPHERSMTLGRLASHIAEMPTWCQVALRRDAFDMAPPGEPALEALNLADPAEILEVFDRNVAAAREAIAGTSDETFLEDWTLLRGGETIFTLPRIAVVRSWVLNHAIHHRGQLSVYLRLIGAKVPSIYGPSADEGRLG